MLQFKRVDFELDASLREMIGASFSLARFKHARVGDTGKGKFKLLHRLKFLF